MPAPLLVFISIVSLILPALTYGADFTVNPVRVHFAGSKKTEAIKIKNNSPEEPITLQVSVMAWEQDMEGEDAYTPTEEIVVFPKIFSVKGGEERILRVGARVPPSGKEKTYRLYIEEVPGPDSSATEEAVLKTVMRVGVPVFIAPMEAKASGDIDGARLSGGTLDFRVANTGNVHFIIRSVRIRGADAQGGNAFEAELAGRYLHEGRTRGFSVKVPEVDCPGVKSFLIAVQTDRLPLEERLDVPQGACSP